MALLGLHTFQFIADKSIQDFYHALTEQGMK